MYKRQVYLLAIQAALAKEIIDENRYGELIAELGRLPEKIQKTLDDKERIQWFASKYANAKDIFFIGRGIEDVYKRQVVMDDLADEADRASCEEGFEHIQPDIMLRGLFFYI